MSLGWRHCAVAALLGVMATLGFPPYDCYPLSLLGVLGLAALWRDAQPKQAFLLGMFFGWGHFISGMYWVFISTYGFGGAPLWMGLLLVFLLATSVGLFVALAGWLATWRKLRSPIAWALLQLPAAWLLAELLRDWHPIWSLPWLSLGYAFTDSPLSRLAPLIGVHGMSFVTLLLAGALLLLWRGQLSGRLTAIGTILAVAGVTLLLPMPGSWTQPHGEPMTVGLVQGDIPQELKWHYAQRAPTMQLYRGLSQELLREQPATRLIIWPEAAIPALYEDVRLGFYKDMADWATEAELTLITGILQMQDGGLNNTVRAVGLDDGVYRKRHLVPFGEFFPVPDFMRSFMKGINLDYENLKHGPMAQPLITVDGIALGISICFEDVFGGDIRRELPAADLLVNVTNDGWFLNSSAPYQHLQIARMRALETGRELLRVSNRGVSGRIGVDGRVYEQLPMFRSGQVVVQAQPYRGSTPYTGWGDKPLWIVAALLLLVIFLLGKPQREV